MEVQSRRDYNCFGCPVYGGFNQTFSVNSSVQDRSDALDVCPAVVNTVRRVMGRNADMYDPTIPADEIDAATGLPVAGATSLNVTNIQYVAGQGINGCSNVRLRTYHMEPGTPAAAGVAAVPPARRFLREYR